MGEAIRLEFLGENPIGMTQAFCSSFERRYPALARHKDCLFCSSENAFQILKKDDRGEMRARRLKFSNKICRKESVFSVSRVFHGILLRGLSSSQFAQKNFFIEIEQISFPIRKMLFNGNLPPGQHVGDIVRPIPGKRLKTGARQVVQRGAVLQPQTGRSLGSRRRQSGHAAADGRLCPRPGKAQFIEFCPDQVPESR